MFLVGVFSAGAGSSRPGAGGADVPHYRPPTLDHPERRPDRRHSRRCRLRDGHACAAARQEGRLLQDEYDARALRTTRGGCEEDVRRT